MPQCAEGSDVVLFASSVAIAISRELSLNEISILSSFLNAVGDNRGIIAAKRAACQAKQP